MRGDECGVIGFNFGIGLLGTISFTARTVGPNGLGGFTGLVCGRRLHL
jgi:hypothetical protein